MRQILAHDSEKALALAGDSVTVVLAGDIDLGRGDLIADATQPPLEAGVAGPRVAASQWPLPRAASGRARHSLQAPLFVDRYEAVRASGAFILIDEATNHTVAAGLVQ